MPKIKIHYSVYLLIILSLYTGSTFKITMIIFTILFHELCHFIFLKMFNCPIYKFELSIIGGVIETNKNNIKLYQKLIIDFSGICGNIILVVILKIALPEAMKFLIWYNYLMIGFNLIPIIPLDGYQVLNDILLSFYEDEYTLVIIKIVDIIFLFLLLACAIIFQVYGFIFIIGFLFVKLITYNKDYQMLLNFSYLYKN